MRLAFDIFPADDVRGTRLVRLEGDDYLQGTMFRTELVGMGHGRLVVNVHQSFVNATNFARDNYVEVFDLELSGSHSLGAFFLEEGDFAALSSREQSGRILTFEGRGELSYLSRGILGPTALSGASGPLDQHWIDTLGSWKWGSLGSETYGAILRRIIYESALMTPDPLPEVQLVDIEWDDVVDYNAVPWPGFTGEYDIPVGTGLLQAVSDLLKHGIELVADADFKYRAYNSGTYGTDRTSATFASGKVRFEAGVNIADELNRSIHGATDASHALLKDRTGLVFEVIPSPEYSGGDVVKYVGIEAPENTGPEDLEFLGENILSNRRTYVDQFVFPHPTDYVPLQGLYVPGPPDSAGHYWKGDYVTIHTGTSPYDANEQTIRVAAIEWNVDDAGNWLPTVELGAQYLSVGEARFANQLTTLVSSPHTHPGNPELCRIGSPPISPTVLFERTWSYTGGNLNSDSGDYPWGSGWHASNGPFAGPCALTGGTPDTLFSSPHLAISPGQVISLEGDVSAQRVGLAYDKSVKVVWYSSTGDTSPDSEDAYYMPGSNNTTIASFSKTWIAPSGVGAFALVADDNIRMDNWHLQVIDDDGQEGIAGDLPLPTVHSGNQSVGTSIRAARCDHEHEHGLLSAEADDYHEADQIDYDGSDAGLAATDVKAALDEIAGSSASTIDDLTDVIITGATEDDTLRFNGSEWVNDNRRWEALTDGEDVFVWEGDDLVHEWNGAY